MANTAKPSARAGGIFMAIGSIGGLYIGGQFGQPIIGLLVGFALGAAIAALVWLFLR